MIEGQPVRLAFPDGRPLLGQNALLVGMFALIEDEWRKAVAEESKRGNQ